MQYRCTSDTIQMESRCYLDAINLNICVEVGVQLLVRVGGWPGGWVVGLNEINAKLNSS